MEMFSQTYLTDIIERYKIKNDEELEMLLDFIKITIFAI